MATERYEKGLAIRRAVLGKDYVDEAIDGADAYILDLEDSVPVAQKEKARAMVLEAIPDIARRTRAALLVRVNGPNPWTTLCTGMLESLCAPLAATPR